MATIATSNFCGASPAGALFDPTGYWVARTRASPGYFARNGVPYGAYDA